MKFKQLLEFYTLCMQTGFCKIDQDEKSKEQGVVSIIGPVKKAKDQEKPEYRLRFYLFDDESKELLSKIKKTCWISGNRSRKIVKKMLKFDNYFTTLYPMSKIEYFLKFKKSKVKIIATVDNIKQRKTLKFSLFTVNNNVE